MHLPASRVYWVNPVLERVRLDLKSFFVGIVAVPESAHLFVGRLASVIGRFSEIKNGDEKGCAPFE